ncbi:MAG: type II toxin-antitoxin system RelE/ParE family toxin, partial [Bacteroidota bacterium]
QVRVVWDTQAKNSFKKQIIRISKDSIQSAEKVRIEILDIIDGLLDHPLMFPPDKYKKDNDGNYRAFEKYNIRIAYLKSSDAVRILRVRHVKQEPEMY